MTYQYFIVKYREGIFGNSTHDRVPQKPTLCYGRVWEYQHIFVKCRPYCQETQQIGFGNLIDFEITCRRYFADKTLGDLH